MEIDASVPKALYQANVDLALRIAALLQESGAQWFDLFAEEANARLQEATAQGKQPGATGKPLSPDMALKWMQANPGRWQALLMQAANNQSRFAQGLQAALQQWQAACADTLGTAAMEVFPGAPAGLESLPGFKDMADLMQGFVAHFVPKVDAGATAKAPPRAEPAAASRPAAKSSASKTADRKPARKTTPAGTSAAGKAGAKASSASGKAGKAPRAPKPAPAAVTRSRRSKKTDS